MVMLQWPWLLSLLSSLILISELKSRFHSYPNIGEEFFFLGGEVWASVQDGSVGKRGTQILPQ